MRIGYWRRSLIGAVCGCGRGRRARAAAAGLRIRGQIEKVDGNTLTVKARDGAMLTVNVPDNVRVMNFVKASLADIKPNSYIGVTAMPQADGSQKAIAIHIFLEAQRGTGEGHRPWDLRPGSTMTNAAVETTAAERRRPGADGEVQVRRQDRGEEGDRAAGCRDRHLCAGRQERAESRARRSSSSARRSRPTARLQAQAVNVGKGVTPPM